MLTSSNVGIRQKNCNRAVISAGVAYMSTPKPENIKRARAFRTKLARRLSDVVSQLDIGNTNLAWRRVNSCRCCLKSFRNAQIRPVNPRLACRHFLKL